MLGERNRLFWIALCIVLMLVAAITFASWGYLKNCLAPNIPARIEMNVKYTNLMFIVREDGVLETILFESDGNLPYFNPQPSDLPPIASDDHMKTIHKKMETKLSFFQMLVVKKLIYQMDATPRQRLSLMGSKSTYGWVFAYINNRHYRSIYFVGKRIRNDNALANRSKDSFLPELETLAEKLMKYSPLVCDKASNLYYEDGMIPLYKWIKD